MRNLTGIVMLLFLFTTFALNVSSAQGISELATLDQLRTRGDTVKVTTRIEVYENGELESNSVLDVYVGTDRRSLAVYRSEREAGQKVLMVDDQFWLFLPSSKRAMRITAMQKLMGEASVGDVASLEWQQDYKLVERIEEGQEIKLSLEAGRKGLSYKSVTLWVADGTYHPIRADFYLKSGKLAKQATFDLEQDDLGEWYMGSLSLQDKVRKDQLTKIYYDKVEPLEMKDKWFSPNFLLRDTP